MNLSRRTRESPQIVPLSSLSSRVDINQGDEFGQTALHYAMRANDIDTVKTLITRGADVEAGDLFKETPLHLAAWFTDYEVVLELLEKRPDINARTRFGNTVLHFAAERENDPVKVVIAFLERGADISIRDEEGHTAMYYGMFGSSDLHKCLLRAQIMQERQLRYDSEFPIDVGYSKILFCQKLCSLHPGDVFLRHQVGNVFCKEGIYNEGSDWFDVSVGHDPENSAVSRVDDIRHYDAICDNCEYPLIGRRYRCICCDDFDLCRDCFTAPIRLQHSPGSTHEFVKIPSDKWVAKMIESGKFKANHQGKANNDGNTNTQMIKGTLNGDGEVIQSFQVCSQMKVIQLVSLIENQSSEIV